MFNDIHKVSLNKLRKASLNNMLFNRLPLFISNLIDENDLVVTFYKLMKESTIIKSS